MLDIDIFFKKIRKKSRLIGIDPGGKRIGIAISDENKITYCNIVIHLIILVYHNTTFFRGSHYEHFLF